MTEDIGKPEAKTFNLGEALAGRNYPETTVKIYLDERAGLAIQEFQERLTVLSGLVKADESRLEEYNSLEADLAELVESLESKALKVLVRGVPRKTRDDVLKKVLAEHPNEKDSFGREKGSVEQNEAFTRLIWQAHIVQVTPPDGEGDAVVPSEDDIDALLSLAPEADVQAIDAAINKMENASRGFEVAARGADFLSKP